jgi:C1A family cysteine protease
MPGLDITALSMELTRVHARWQARDTPQSALDDIQKRALLGVVRDDTALSRAMAPSAGAPPVASFAPAVDWRNHGGNHVTPVKHQRNCGSCVSFCTTAVVESMASIERGKTLDLSEADLHFCSAHGASCGGWWPDSAYAEIKARGIVNDAAFPYMRAFDEPPREDPATHLWIPHCVAVDNRNASAVRISSSSTLSNIVERKNYLSSVGPCSAVLHVFDDFYSHGSGVYHHVTGADFGLHCVEVIGYSEAEGCWICKNSWGTAWGDSGFFKIAYGEAGIDTEFPFWTAQGVVLPLTAQAAGDPVAYTFTNEASRLLEQHNLFRDTDGHIQALWFNFAEGWHREDRSLLPGTPAAVDDPCVYTFTEPSSGLLEQHNLFRSADGHIHALWFNFAEGWHHEDRSALVPGVPPAVSKPHAYAFVGSGVVEQHNLFRSGDGHVHALWFNFAEGWHHEDRSTFFPGMPAALGTPFGYAFVNNDTGLLEQHNLFRAADGHIHALWFNFAEGWHHEDRSVLLPGIPPAVGDPFGYVFIGNGVVEQHNLFRTADGHIHALWFNFAEGWHHEDRTALLPGVPPAVGDPFGYTFINQATGLLEQHNLFRTADGHIHALWFNFAEGWHHEDRTAFFPGVPAAIGEPVGYAFTGNGIVEQHNLFRTAGGHIHALWFNFAEGWHHEERS